MVTAAFVRPGPRGPRRAPARVRTSGLRPPPPTAAEREYMAALVPLARGVLDEATAILRRHGLLPARLDAADGDAPTVDPAAVARARSELDSLRVRVARHQRAPLAQLDTVSRRVAAHSGRQWEAALARLGVNLDDVRQPHLEHLRSHWISQNTDLITTMQRDVVDRVRDVISDTRGLRVEAIASALETATGASESHARLIARDQTLKLNAQITSSRHAAAGVTEYVWRTSRDERVREDHKVLDGTRQKYADPPVVDRRTGARGNPGTWFQCRCTADPILPDLDD